MRRRLFRFLVAAVTVSVAVMVPTGPAWACSCVQQSDAEYFAPATAVFTGTPLESSGTDPVVWSFNVDAVQKGDPGGVQQVRVSRVDAEDCRFGFKVGTRYQVFAGGAKDTLTTGTCTGTRALAPGVEPYRPAPGGSPPTSTTGPPPTTPATTLPGQTSLPVTTLSQSSTTAAASTSSSVAGSTSTSSSGAPSGATDGDGGGRAALWVLVAVLVAGGGVGAIAVARRRRTGAGGGPAT